MPNRKQPVRGARLRVLRESKGLTQNELSELLASIGVKFSQARISRLERGWTPPSHDVIVGLALVLDTSVDYLLGITGDPAPQARDKLFVSREAEEAARLIDGVPMYRREALLSALRAMIGIGDFEIAS